MCGICYVCLKEKCAVCCIRSACVSVIVGFAGLCTAVNSEPRCNETVGFFLYEDLTSHEDCIWFDGVSW